MKSSKAMGINIAVINIAVVLAVCVFQIATLIKTFPVHTEQGYKIGAGIVILCFTAHIIREIYRFSKSEDGMPTYVLGTNALALMCTSLQILTFAILKIY